MNNDYAKKRHGVTPTYRKKKGFQPIQFTWKGTIIDAVFRSGKWHGMTRGTAKEMIKELVHLIRSRYRSDATIVLEMDAGFFDQMYFKLCDDLNAGFVASGKMHPGVKEHVGQTGTPWREYRNPNQIWDYVEFGYRAGNWSRFYRAFYTRPRGNEHDPQINLEFLRPDNVILTNLGTNPRVLQHLAATERKQLLNPEWIIEAHHQRGTEELTHRAFKDFGFEALPSNGSHRTRRSTTPCFSPSSCSRPSRRTSLPKYKPGLFRRVRSPARRYWTDVYSQTPVRQLNGSI